jgi:hypothetical protein
VDVAFESANEKFYRLYLNDPVLKVLILSEVEMVHHDLNGEYKDACSVFTHPRMYAQHSIPLAPRASG